MVDANAFDIKPTFPIAGIAELIANRSYKEAQIRSQQRQDLFRGLEDFRKGVDSLVSRRMQMAQALTQADLLLQNPDISEQVGLENPATQPIASPMAGAPAPTIGKTAQGTDNQGNVLENPIQNMPSIPRNMELMRQKLAGAIQGTKGEDFLKYLQPDMVEESTYSKDSSGREVRSTRMVPRGSKFHVENTGGVGTRPKLVGVNPDNGEPISYHPTRGVNVDSSGNPYTGRIIPTTEGSEEQRRGTLATTALNSIKKIRQIVDTNPGVLSEIKAIRLSPGRVYSQLASSDAKKLYIDLKEAISNELYLKTGATANETEIEDKTVSYLAALNDSVPDFKNRMQILEEQISPFDQRRRGKPGGSGDGGKPKPATSKKLLQTPNGTMYEEVSL